MGAPLQLGAHTSAPQAPGSSSVTTDGPRQHASVCSWHSGMRSHPWLLPHSLGKGVHPLAEGWSYWGTGLGSARVPSSMTGLSWGHQGLAAWSWAGICTWSGMVGPGGFSTTLQLVPSPPPRPHQRKGGRDGRSRLHGWVNTPSQARLTFPRGNGALHPSPELGLPLLPRVALGPRAGSQLPGAAQFLGRQLPAHAQSPLGESPRAPEPQGRRP